MQIPIFSDIITILGLSVLIILVFQRIRLPSILGFLLTGIIAGPFGLSLIQAQEEVELLSEIGVIFLLFIIGIEFSLKGLSSVRNTVLIGGTLQVGGTIALTVLLGYSFGLALNEAVFLGFLFSLSSTAIVLKLLQERGELNSPHGRVAIAILIFQDLMVVPMMLAVPLLTGETENLIMTLAILVVKVMGVIAFIAILAKFLVPYVFRLVIKTKSRELFLLTIIVLCFATAWLTSTAGLSLALGAFFAGLVISDSDYSHMATANILPFREIFLSFFFVSIGMLLDLTFFITHFGFILLATLAVVLLKFIMVFLSVALLKYPIRTVILTSLSIFQVGEFALLLSMTGIAYGLLSHETYQYFLAVSILSMASTPFAMQNAGNITTFLLSAPLPSAIRKRLSGIKQVRQHRKIDESYHDHLVIIGYGINGENLAKAAHHSNIPYVIIELDPASFQRAKDNGEPVIMGDASDITILQHVHIHEARIVVIAISDPDSAKKIVRIIRSFTQTAHIIVRTRYLKEIEENLRLGADEVIPEEFETSIEIFTRVLKHYLVPLNEIQSLTREIRSHNYEILREISGMTGRISTLLNVPDVEIATLRVMQGNNKIVGKALVESRLRSEFDITVLAIKRNNKYLTNLSPDTTIEQDDLLYLFGNPDDIAKLNLHFRM